MVRNLTASEDGTCLRALLVRDGRSPLRLAETILAHVTWTLLRNRLTSSVLLVPRLLPSLYGVGDTDPNITLQRSGIYFSNSLQGRPCQRVI